MTAPIFIHFITGERCVAKHDVSLLDEDPLVAAAPPRCAEGIGKILGCSGRRQPIVFRKKNRTLAAVSMSIDVL